ncbi:stress response protein NST1 isoform X2 [Solanum dulcamara]|uniref:stress response protein NST1 isoform X2 n=1 Tax=Solanum dulcamara TaxID=45834 RepID=UPI0024851ECC|nr:stress response protein NST1 isoform X2 [Solanum dulcamara]
MRLSIFSPMKLSLSHLPINTTRSTFLSPTSVSVAECTRSRLSILKLIYHASMVQKDSLSSGFAVSSEGEDSYKLYYAKNGSAEMFQFMRCNARKLSADMSNEQVLTDDFQEENYSNMDKGFNSKDGKEKEVERRRKIGLANSGKVPWNKGRKHSPETREKIRQRTKEALSDPKVRRKMSECPRSLSNQTKIRIRASLRKLWGERLQWKRSKEKFFQSWAESIANAAKVGGSDQEELEWDSYDNIKREIALKQLQLSAEKAKAKEMTRIRAERAAQRKTEKMQRLAQRRKEREEKQKVEGKMKRPRRRSKQEKEELAVAEELKLKAKLVKIQKKKSTLSHVCREHRRAWEKLDVSFIKRPQVQKPVSLADQIRSAKKRTEDVNGKAFSIASSESQSIEVSAEARFFTVETK